MQSYSEMLRENFSNMHTDHLLERRTQGGLTEEALQILDEELKKRGVGADDLKAYSDGAASDQHPEDFPDGVTLGQLASPARRYGAQALDQIFAVFAAVLLSSLAGDSGFEGAVLIVTYLGYVSLSDGMPKGQSIGKKLLGMRVINSKSGASCTITESFLRNITTMIPILALIDAIMIFNVRRQRLGDKWANTLVVRT